MSEFFTYILECKDGTLYVGSTNDLAKRLHQHNNSKSGAHYTKIRRPVTLKYSEKFKTLSLARKREAEVKKWSRHEKLELIKSKNQDKINSMKEMNEKTKNRIYKMTFASVYPLYVAKVERKGQTKAEVDEVIRWLTGYTEKGMESQIKKQTTFEEFFAKAPKMNPKRKLITGVICGVRLEEITDPLMREIRYLDKLVDELAKGRAMEKILRKD